MSGTWSVCIRGTSVTQLLDCFRCSLPGTKGRRPKDPDKGSHLGRGMTGGIRKMITCFFYWATKRRPVVSEEKTSGIKAAPCDQRAGALEKIFMLQTPPG